MQPENMQAQNLLVTIQKKMESGRFENSLIYFDPNHLILLSSMSFAPFYYFTHS